MAPYNPYPNIENPLYQQSVPMTQGNVTNYAQKSYIDYQKESAVIEARSAIELRKYEEKRRIDEDCLQRMMQAKADIKIKADMLSEQFHLLDDGSIIRRQEFFLEKPREYLTVNFKLIKRPVIYIQQGQYEAKILNLQVILKNQEIKALYLNMEKTETAYYLKKFRCTGLEFHRKKNETQEALLDIIQVFASIADKIELPRQKGFYVDRDNRLQYAEKTDLIWGEVKRYAE